MIVAQEERDHLFQRHANAEQQPLLFDLVTDRAIFYRKRRLSTVHAH